MANIIATGAQFAFATTYGAAVNVTAATNAANAVLTLAAGHGTVVGDFVEIASSGWGRAEGRVFRASVVSTNDVTFEGLDTTDTSLFPAGGAVGSSVRRITAWTSITQVGREIQITGNELETGDATYISDLVRKNVVLFRAPTNVTLPIFFDPSLSWVPAARTATNANAIRAMRAIWPGGARTIFNGYVSYSDAPTIQDGTLRTTFELLGQSVPTTYAT
jgi:hypothetical protein